MATTDTTVDSLREHRVACFEDLRFTRREAEKLADAKDDTGFALSWHKVKKMLDSGCSHRTALRIFEPLEPEVEVEEVPGD